MRNQDIVRAYSIQEVSKLLNIPTGTIRQWEKDLHDLLIIPRTKQGARYYTQQEIELLKTIQKLRLQNVGKGMIRNLLEKHLLGLKEEIVEPAEEALELAVTTPNQPRTMSDIQAFEALSLELNQLKTHVVQEVRQEMAYQRSILLDEIKNQLETTSLQTVSDLSKSIQRANDKRKADVLVLSEAIEKNSKHTSETLSTLEGSLLTQTKTIETAVKSISSAAQLDNEELIEEVSQLLADVKNDVRSVAFSLHEDQQNVRNTVHELQEFSKLIQQKEDGFQELVLSFREAAAAKNAKKPWWRVW